MDINNLPEVKVDPRGGFKYIVAVVSDQNGNQKTVIRADETCEAHAYIMGDLVEEVGPEIDIECIGGGRIRVDPDRRTIEIWKFSEAYGQEPDRQQTVAMLQNAFPGFKVTASS